MPVLFNRHAVTVKNLLGGPDNASTPLHEDGWIQGGNAGRTLVNFCKTHGIVSVQPITSGHVRADQTWEAEAAAFVGQDIEIRAPITDPRIGEIKFLSREFVPTPENPGLFGRVIDGSTLAERIESLHAVDKAHLQNVPDDHLVILVSHRSTTRLLAMVHLGRDIAWLEALPKMNNCELWLAAGNEVKVVDPGYATDRDGYDPRRSILLPESSRAGSPGASQSYP